MTATQAWTEVGGRLATLRRRTAARLGEARARVERDLALRLERPLVQARARIERPLEQARARIERPIVRARTRIEKGARRGWANALGTVRDALDVPARGDLERLGKRLESVQQRLEAIGREKINGGRRKK